jgi:signal transduction histidine kinase
MISVRWVHVASAVMLALLVLIAVALRGRDAGAALAPVAVLAAAYLAVAVRALRQTAADDATGAAPGPPRPRAVLFLAIAIPAASVAVAVLPSLAVVQCVLCPLVWLLLPRTRDAIVGNLLLTGAIAGGFLLGIGTTPAALTTAAISQGLSLAGSVALGLWITRIERLSQERLDLLDGLRAAQAQVAELGREAGAARERARLSADLHDTVAQDLTGLVMLAQRGRRELRAGEPAAAAATLGLVEDGARDALTQTRAIVAATAPVELADGVAAALARLGARFARETGVPVAVRSDAGGGAPDRAAEVVLLRCAQEGLANVRRHAGASAVELVLVRDGDDLVLTIRDDGRGFDPARASAGYGLDGMRRRLDAGGGRLDVGSGPGGTSLTARIPAHSPDPRPGTEAAADPSVGAAAAHLAPASAAVTPARA